MAKQIGKCNLCDLERPLCKSHIIPKAFFRDAMAKERDCGLNMITPERIEVGKMAGEYEHLLCQNCEVLIGKYDDYGTRFFRRQAGERLSTFNGEAVPDDIDLIGNVDLRLLRLFIISVLWRASISSRPFFDKVDLGPFELVAKQIIRDEITLSDGLFPFFMNRYAETDHAKRMLFNPLPTRIGQLRFFNVNMGGFNVAVKVDKRDLGCPLDFIWKTLTGAGVVLVYEKRLFDSEEYTAIKQVARMARANSQKPVQRNVR
ncbi:hypothetical protein JKG47_03275 [Acidithiobacillus sp. MC6.1]|nr:hypothetical protein [Acidithiobacillus sp. MC6.1]